MALQFRFCDTYLRSGKWNESMLGCCTCRSQQKQWKHLTQNDNQSQNQTTKLSAKVRAIWNQVKRVCEPSVEQMVHLQIWLFDAWLWGGNQMQNDHKVFAPGRGASCKMIPFLLSYMIHLAVWTWVWIVVERKQNWKKPYVFVAVTDTYPKQLSATTTEIRMPSNHARSAKATLAIATTGTSLN